MAVTPTYSTPTHIGPLQQQFAPQSYQPAYMQPAYVQPGTQQVLMYNPQLVPPPPSKGKLLASLFGRGGRGAKPVAPPVLLSAPVVGAPLTTIA